jgi:hypothetical protein
MSKLKAFDITVAEEGYCEGIVKYRRAVYDKSEADKAIAEKDAEIAELKAEIESLKASHYAEMVDAGMRERRLKRALWIARAELCRRLDIDRYLRNHRNSWYNENCLTWDDSCVAMDVKMRKAESMCRAMAEKWR